MKTKIFLLTALMTTGLLTTISLVRAQNTKSLEVAYSKVDKAFADIHNLPYMLTNSESGSKSAALDNIILSCAKELEKTAKFKPSADLGPEASSNTDVSLDSLTDVLSKQVKYKPEAYLSE